MVNQLKFCFVLKGKFDLKSFQRTVKLVTKEEFKDENLEFDKSIYEHYHYGYNDKKNEIAIDFYWYPSRNKLHFYAPNFDYAPRYCIKLLKIISQFLKLEGFGYDTYSVENHEYVDYNEEEMGKIRIWSVNLFPPSEVQKYSREKLLKAPCELIEEWEDGAIFMMIHKNSFSSAYDEREKLRKYLAGE